MQAYTVPSLAVVFSFIEQLKSSDSLIQNVTTSSSLAGWNVASFPVSLCLLDTVLVLSPLYHKVGPADISSLSVLYHSCLVCSHGKYGASESVLLVHLTVESIICNHVHLTFCTQPDHFHCILFLVPLNEL